MKPFLWILVALTTLFVVAVPVAYFAVSTELPILDSEYDLERLMRVSIESERRSAQLGLYEKSKDPVTWPKPEFARLPKNLVALYITERGCPTYFQTPREDGFAWSKRVLVGVAGVEPEDSDGWCERVFALNLARRIGAKGRLQEAVAIHKLHRFLKKDGLVAYDLHSVRVRPGIIGVEAAAKALFNKNLYELTLSEQAEFSLATPPHGYWEQLSTCTNPTLIRQNRDVIIDNLRKVGLVPVDLAANAKLQPVACLREPE